MFRIVTKDKLPSLGSGDGCQTPGGGASFRGIPDQFHPLCPSDVLPEGNGVVIVAEDEDVESKIIEIMLYLV